MAIFFENRRGRHFVDGTAGRNCLFFCFLQFFLLFCLFLPFSSDALAAFKSSKDEGAKEDAFNPKPLEDDIFLPMPCGLQMTLSAVAVPVSSSLHDKIFRMGVANGQDSGRNIYERQFDGHLSAPFSFADLPQEWQKVLAKSNLAGDRYYFIGKYEVSRLQWQSVMDTVNGNGEANAELCPKLSAQEGSLPQGGISWFDAQEFLQKYNAWLVRTHLETLPRFAETPNIGFFRLPTEEEWEYAARGGPLVPAEWWEDRDIFPLMEGRELKDYGIFDADDSSRRAAPIGSRNPNPLGVHDTIGNMRELVDGFFRLSIAEKYGGAVGRRLHGSAGGILSKGGSYLSREEAVIPGARDELALFTVNGELRPNDMGLRILLSSLNIPDARKLENLRTEEAAHPAEEADMLLPENQNNPLAAVRFMASGADGTLKANLEKLALLLEDQQNAENTKNLLNLEQSLHSLLYQAETLRAFALRYISAKKQIASLEAMPKTSLDEKTRKKVERALGEARTDLSDYMESLKMGANYYRQGLGTILQANKEDLARLLAQIGREYGGAGIFNEHIRQNLNQLEKFVEKGTKSGLSGITSGMILKNTIPEQHLRQLPL